MTSSRGRSLPAQLLVVTMVAVMVLAPFAPFVGTGAVGTASASDGVHYVTDSGFEVEDTSGGTALPSFPDDDTLDLPSINLSSSGDAFVTLDQRTGTFTNLTNIDDSPSVMVNPDDKQVVELNGNLDTLNFSDASYGASSSTVDMVYSAASQAGLYIEDTGLPQGYTVEAVDLDTGTTVGSAGVASDGSITFSALDSGSHTVTLRRVDTVAPSISSFDLTNPSGQDVTVTVTSDEPLSTIAASITDPESATLTTADFTETDSTGGTYTYEATYSGSTDGDYTVTLDTAEDENGNDGASGQSATTGVDTTDPTVSSFGMTNPSGTDLAVSFDSDQPLSSITVSITGEEAATLSEAFFSETANSDGSFTYEAVYSVSNLGSYTAVLESFEDDAGNEGQSGQSAKITLESPVTAFSVESLSTNGPLTPGETLTTTATITNTGNTEGETTVEFDIADVSDSKTVSLAADESQTLTFDWTTGSQDAGTYTVEVTTPDDTATQSVSVQGESPTVQSAVVTDETPDRLDLGFDRPVEVTNDTAGFTVTLGGDPVELQRASATDQTVELSLGATVSPNETLLVSYDNESKNLQGTDGTDVASVSGRQVTNQVEPELGVSVALSAGSYLFGVENEVTLRADPSGTALEEASPTYTWTIDGQTVETDDDRLNWTFDQPGEFDTSVTVDAADESDTAQLTLTVEDRVDPSPALTATEAVEPGDDPGFDATASTDNIEIASYEWDFGDGTTDSGSSLTAPTHTYDEPGTYDVTLTVTDTSENTATTTTTVTVEAPDAELSTDTVGFDSVAVGSSDTASISISNQGTVPLSVSTLTIDGADADAFSLGTDNFTVPSGGSQSVGVTFTPTTAQDSTDATLVVETNDTAFEVDLTGDSVDSVVEPVDASVSVGDIDVGGTGTATVEFTNTGELATNLTNATVGSDQMSLAETLPVALSANETVSLAVEFTPAVSETVRTALRVETEDGDTASVSLDGTGVAPRAYYATKTLSFGAVSLDGTQTESIQIRNDGSDTLSVEDVRIQSGPTGDFELLSAPEAIQPGETAAVDVRFAPGETATRQTDLVIETNEPKTPTTRITLEGSGRGANVAVTPRVIDFGETEVGTPETATITVANREDTDTTLTVDQTTLTGTNPDDFDILSGDAPFELAPGESQDIVVEFTAEAVGQREAQLQIRSDAANEPFVNVWLTNTRSYIIVEDASDSTAETGAVSTVQDQSTAAVSVDGTNVEAGNTNRVNVSTPSTLTEPATLETLALQLTEESDFELTLEHTTEVGDPVALGESRQLLRYVQVDQVQAPSGSFTDTGLEFIVDRDALAADTTADEITISRFDESSGTWNSLDTELLTETDDQFRFSVSASSLSTFALTAPESGDDSQLVLESVTVPEQALQESTVDVTATLTNTGESSITKDVQFSVDGETLESKSVTVGAAASRQVEFSLNTREYESVDPELSTAEAIAFYDENGDGVLTTGSEIITPVKDWAADDGYFEPVPVGKRDVTLSVDTQTETETVTVVQEIPGSLTSSIIIDLVQHWSSERS